MVGLFACRQKQESKSWAEDLVILTNTLTKKHEDPFTVISRESFDKKVEQITSELPGLSDMEIKTKIYELVASIGDPHTFLSESSSRFPIKLEWYHSGFYVVGSAIDTSILYQKLIAINSTPIERVIEILSEMIPSDTEGWTIDRLPQWLNNVELLHGSHIIDDTSFATFIFADSIGRKTTVTIPAKGSFSTKRNPRLLRFQETSSNYYFRYLPAKRLLYVNYQKCQQDSVDMGSFSESVFSKLDANSNHKLVIDLRNNSGGNSNVFNPF